MSLKADGHYWVSCPHATRQVNIEGGLIVLAPPVWQAFLFQPGWRLAGWLTHKFGECRIEKLSVIKSPANDR